MTLAQGEIWRWESESAKARPVLILTRDEVLSVLSDVLVAPLTRTLRGIPTELRLGRNDGLAVECVASFDNLFGASRVHLVRRMGAVSLERRHEMCAAIRAVLNC